MHPRLLMFSSSSPLPEPTRAFYKPESEEKPNLWHCYCSHNILSGWLALTSLLAENNCWAAARRVVQTPEPVPTFPQMAELNAQIFTAHSLYLLSTRATEPTPWQVTPLHGSQAPVEYSLSMKHVHNQH